MKRSLQKNYLTKVSFSAFALLFCLLITACGSGGSGGGYSAAPTQAGGIIQGQMVSSQELSGNLRLSETNPVSRAIVWVESDNTITTLTDSQGYFTLTGVPFGISQRIIGKYDQSSTGEIFLFRSEPIVVDAANSALQMNQLSLSKGVFPIRGILKNQFGQPISNGSVKLWGMEFKSDNQGRFSSPPLPGSADYEELLVQAAGYRDLQIELPVPGSQDQEICYQLVLSETNETNFIPVAYFERFSSETLPGQQVRLDLKVIDKDELVPDHFKPIWKCSAGTIGETASPLSINWTAPDTTGLASISAQVTDSRGASGMVEIGIAIGGNKTAVLRVEKVEPNSGGTGETVSIRGSGFGKDKNAVQISFNGTLAPIVSCSDNLIEAQIPQGATTGLLLVIINKFEKSAGVFTVLDADLKIEPAYGPPGSILSISGKDFGSSPTNSEILVNANPAEIVEWTDRNIKAIVPQDASSGMVSVTIEGRNRFAGIFKVSRVFEVSATKTRPGDIITIKGEGFGDQIFNSSVFFNNSVQATVIEWIDEKITIQVPPAALSGPLIANIQEKELIIADLQINSVSSISPQPALPDQEISIIGSGFGEPALESFVTIGSEKPEIISWSDTRIVFKATAKPGVLSVNRSGHISNSTNYEVLNITGISQTHLPNGATLTINGSGFGSSTGFVLFGNEIVSNFQSWRNDEIVVQIPDNLAGNNEVKVSNFGIRSLPINIKVAKIGAADLDEGWIGREVCISGEFLGNGSNSDQVTFSGVVAPVVSWQEDSVKVRVPISAETGPMVLKIGGWPVTLVEEFTIAKDYNYTQLAPDWSGPRKNSRPLLAGVTQDENGNRYITDFDNGWVWKISSDGIQTKFGNLKDPWGIAFNSANSEIFVAESGNDCIRIFDVEGNLLRTIGSSGSGVGQFNRPRGLALVPGLFLLVADSGNNRIQVLSTDGTFVSSFGSYGSNNGEFISPSGIAISEDFEVFIADSGNYRIQKFIPNNSLTPTAWTFGGWLGSSDPNADTPGWLFSAQGLPSDREGGFYSPYGCSVSGDGKLIVADTNNNRVQILDSSNGTFQNYIGASGITSGQYNQPLAVFPIEDSQLLICDSSNGRVQKSSFSGAFISQIVPDTSNLNTLPRRIAVDSSNDRVYVLDQDDGSISVYNRAGEVIQIIGSKGSGREQFYAPQGIAVDGSGNVYVADTGNARIHKISPSGAFLQNWGIYGNGPGQFIQPNALCISHDDQFIFVTDASLNRIQKFDLGGNYISDWGSPGAGDESFNQPSGIASDRDGFLYIADQNNHRIKKYDSNGKLIGWWGSYDVGAQSFWLDPGSNRTGALSDADGAFDTPTDVSVDEEGNVFVADSNNFRIQKFLKNQSENENAGFQTDIYIGENITAVGNDKFAHVYCISSGKRILRFEPEP